MGSQRRYIGSTHMFNVRSDTEFVNGLEIQVTDDGVEASISTPFEPDRRRVIQAGAKEGRAFREMLLAMEQEHMRARRLSGEFAIPKPKGKRRKDPVPVCAVCGGLGGNEDEDGNWVECRACRA